MIGGSSASLCDNLSPAVPLFSAFLFFLASNNRKRSTVQYQKHGGVMLYLTMGIRKHHEKKVRTQVLLEFRQKKSPKAKRSRGFVNIGSVWIVCAGFSPGSPSMQSPSGTGPPWEIVDVFKMMHSWAFLKTGGTDNSIQYAAKFPFTSLLMNADIVILFPASKVHGTDVGNPTNTMAAVADISRDHHDGYDPRWQPPESAGRGRK